MPEGVIVVVVVVVVGCSCIFQLVAGASGPVLYADGSVKGARPGRSPICKMGGPTAVGLFEHSLHSEGL